MGVGHREELRHVSGVCHRELRHVSDVGHVVRNDTQRIINSRMVREEGHPKSNDKNRKDRLDKKTPTKPLLGQVHRDQEHFKVLAKVHRSCTERGGPAE